VRRRRFGVDLLVFASAAILGAIPALSALADKDGDPSVLLIVGEAAISRSFVEREFPHPPLAPDYGHDGQQFYVMAETLPELQEAESHIDRLQYRARRILFPALVAAAPAGAPTVWAMLAVNLAAIGMAGVALSRLATRLGTSPLLGLAAGLTPALAFSARASLADALAFSLALWGVVLWRREPGRAAVLFASGALARELTLIAPAACLVVAVLHRRRERLPVWPLAVPFAAYVAWAGVVGLWLRPSPNERGGPIREFGRLFDLPFQPWTEIGRQQVLMGVAMTVLCLVAAYVLRAELPELTWWLLGEAVLLVTSAPAVSGNTANYLRVAPVVVPAVALAGAYLWRQRRPVGCL
jgi:hypothetical protein